MSSEQQPRRAKMNRTLRLSAQDRIRLAPRLGTLAKSGRLESPPQGTIVGDALEVAGLLPAGFVDLLLLDPPYNLNKSFNGRRFSRRPARDYAAWLDRVVTLLKPQLRPTATVYVCGDWLTSASIFGVCAEHFIVRNRITWEREKGRGAAANWKNCSEDIWFCTSSDDYTFNAASVKLRRRVIAPYRNSDGSPKGWTKARSGNFRDTYPSNLWTDISVPFWSMPENTDHPTQKPEKLVAKLLLASTKPGDFVLDPFLGSGTTSVVAKKLGRRYLGIELDEQYCLLAERRLELAESRPEIQGLRDGVFWERNTASFNPEPTATADVAPSMTSAVAVGSGLNEMPGAPTSVQPVARAGR
jgi:site-specific DNA-methyltransferase (adenine-specific)